MSDTPLFPDLPEVLSPRLAWIRKHGVITYYHAPGHGVEPTWFAGFQEWWPDLTGIDFFATETAQNGDSRVAEGDAEDEVLERMSIWHRLSHWTVAADTNSVPEAEKNQGGSR